MVIKTDTCFYTELRIYPGHGIQFARKDGKLLSFLNKKAKSLYHQKIKAQRLTWTQAWRRRHKKGKAELAAKLRRKRVGRVYKAIQGITLEDIKTKRAQPAAAKLNAEAANLRDIKDRKKKAKEAAAKKPVAKKAAKAAAPGFTKVPKLSQARRKAAAANSTGR